MMSLGNWEGEEDEDAEPEELPDGNAAISPARDRKADAMCIFAPFCSFSKEAFSMPEQERKGRKTKNRSVCREAMCIATW